MKNISQFYHEARQNKWLGYFTVFCRIALACGFIPSGIVKLTGERFTALPGNHPLGHYFDALHQTGFYYNFIGFGQLLTALLLLIPRTALLGAIIYFPTILNICVLTYATRFEGTRITTLMLLANLYLLFWDYERLKHLVLFQQPTNKVFIAEDNLRKKTFPFVFFGGVIFAVAAVVVGNMYLFEIRPGNSVIECTNGAKGSRFPDTSQGFCDCIYNKGKTLEKCLEEYETAKKKEIAY